MSNIKRLLLICTIMLLTGAGSAYAFSDESGEELWYIPWLGFLTFIAAGLFFATTGYIKKIARRSAGDDVYIDWRKVGGAVVLGCMIGVGSFIYSAMDDDSEIYISTWREFVAQVLINMATVHIVYTFLISPYKRKDTIPDELEDIDSEDVPEELPPGKL